jgi:Ras-related protein Rab-5C
MDEGVSMAAPEKQVVATHKCVIIGDSNVGKSSFLVRFVRGEFSEQTRSTISAAFLTRRVTAGGATCEFQIWDTAGQERFRSLNTPMYYRGAKAALLLYDISSAASFENIKGWFTQITMCGDKGCVLAIVGNKSDLEDKREVPAADGRSFAEAHNLLFFESSAQSGAGIEETFAAIAQLIPDSAPPAPPTAAPKSIKLTLPDGSCMGGRKRSCC